MCEYVKSNMCQILHEQCPWMYICPKTGQWTPNQKMPADCKVKRSQQVPASYSKVEFEKDGYLYVNLGEMTVKVLNPFADIPLFVKCHANKDGTYKIQK